MKMMTLTEITSKLEEYCKKDGFKLVSEYTKAKEPLYFIHTESGVKHTQTWDTIRSQDCISMRNNNDYYRYTIEQKLEEYDYSLITQDIIKDVTKVTIKCNNCDNLKEIQCNGIKHKLTLCRCTYNPYRNNGGINITTIKRNPDKLINLYVVSFDDTEGNKVYKIGLYKNDNYKLRFLGLISQNLNCHFYTKLNIVRAYYIEQTIIRNNSKFQYTGCYKGAGYTECFENINDIYLTKQIMSLLEETQDRKLCELLESLEADNQQPSFTGM
jgi:hypothetical protein